MASIVIPNESSSHFNYWEWTLASTQQKSNKLYAENCSIIYQMTLRVWAQISTMNNYHCTTSIICQFSVFITIIIIIAIHREIHASINIQVDWKQIIIYYAYSVSQWSSCEMNTFCFLSNVHQLRLVSFSMESNKINCIHLNCLDCYWMNNHCFNWTKVE